MTGLLPVDAYRTAPAAAVNAPAARCGCQIGDTKGVAPAVGWRVVNALAAYRPVLRNGPLVRLLVGEFVSSIGDWLYLVAVLLLVYQLTADPVLLGIVGAARLIPYLVLSIPAGIVADRFDRRMILLTTDIIRGLLMVVMAVLSASGAPVWTIIGLAILGTCASAFFGPAITAYLPVVVGDEADLGPANSAWGILDNLAFIIGPAVAGLLIAASGLTLAFVINATSFAVIAVVLATLPSARRQEPSETKALAADSKAGAPVAAGRSATLADAARGSWGPLALDFATSFGGGALGVLTVLIAIEVLGAGEAAAGYLNAATGVGGVVAGFLAGGLVARRLDLPIVAGAAVGGVALAVLALARDLPLALVAIAFAVGALLLLDIVNVTLVQRVVPDELRGRSMGLIQTSGTIAAALGSLVGPILAAVVGVPLVLVLLGVSVAGISLLALVLTRRSGGLEPTAIDPRRLAILAGSIFRTLPPARLETAARRLEPMTVEAGQVVVEQGALADRFFLIEEGRFLVSRNGPTGEREELRRMGAGEGFGQLGILGSGVRTATVTAETDGRLWALDRDAFLELVSSGPGLSTRLLDLHRTGITSSPSGAA
jgi:MFS family permease